MEDFYGVGVPNSRVYKKNTIFGRKMQLNRF